jgi:gamma-glutamyl-gamma-aminobutyrate hydrolase PuuD
VARRVVPIVGVTTYRQQASWGPWDRPAAVLAVAYADCVAAAGGRPVLLPPCVGPGGDVASAPGVVDALDALVLVGGGDIDPARYGQAPHRCAAGIDPARDRAELDLLIHALAADLPLLAICRGMQLVNVHLGGSLVQHLPDVTGSDAHQPAQGCFSAVDVVTEPGSVLSKVMGDTATVRCSHHQAVDRVGDGLVVSARATDGVVEALEIPGARFTVGVQWHPEEEADLRLFEALVSAT